MSCGVRETLRFLAQHKLVICFHVFGFKLVQVDVMVTTGGAVEEDIMKCFNPHFIGDFKLPGKQLRQIGTAHGFSVPPLICMNNDTLAELVKAPV